MAGTTMIQGLHYVRSKRSSGPVTWYVYAWRGGPCILRAEGAAKPKLTREALNDYLKAKEGHHAHDNATLNALVREWRRSPEWQGLAQSTRNTWETALSRIEEKWGKTPLSVWNDPRMVGKVLAWRDSYANVPRAADIGITVLSRLLEWGRLRARVTLNVASGVPQLYRGADRSSIIWTEEDMARFRHSALALGLGHVGDVLELAALTGFRRADLAAVTFDEVGEHAIVRTAMKKSRGRRRRAAVPLLPETRALLDQLRCRRRQPGVNTLLVNSFGRSWGSPVSVGDRFQTVRDHAGIMEPGDPKLGVPDRPKHLHDLRGTFVTRLCRAQLSDEEIANIVAWSPQNVAEIRRRYVDDAAVVVAIGQRLSTAKL